MNNPYWTDFNKSIEGYSLPDKFTYPFYYDPHPLARIASEQLQDYLSCQSDMNHNFGLDSSQNDLAIGKMFGVLVVQDDNDKIGFIAAFSGKVGGTNHHPGFVPPVFDMLVQDGYFNQESIKLDHINKNLIALENDEVLMCQRSELAHLNKKISQILYIEKSKIKFNQKERKKLREALIKKMTTDEYETLQEQHKQCSINDQFLYNEYEIYLHQKNENLRRGVKEKEQILDELRWQRKQFSNSLQSWLFDQYNFLNADLKFENVRNLFKNRVPDIPPAGAGDCAAPKLLQYAFMNQLKPIALAEFWWGVSPKSEVRKHTYYYPACRGKCEPILAHMLKGLDVDPNPLLINPAVGKELDKIYEDEYMIAVNKPAEFLSVPGKFITDSVQERMKKAYPNATGPLIVHRLDMSTSGILLIAKSKEIHKMLQEQFIARKIKKRYVALLDGVVIDDEGYIDLPLRVDLDNRPCQLVCYEYGKPTRTKYQVIAKSDDKTLVYFYPITGRTHQLRVHAAHHLGLDAPIWGDDLYGRKGKRLYLHAESITFQHPISKKVVTLQVDADFGIGD